MSEVFLSIDLRLVTVVIYIYYKTDLRYEKSLAKMVHILYVYNVKVTSIQQNFARLSIKTP